MRFPSATPTAVRGAIRGYVGARRAATVLTIVGTTAAAWGAVVVAGMLADRLVELPVWLRSAGPLASWAVLAVGGAALLWSFIAYRPGARGSAIELDASLPANEDRWATAVDLAERRERGEPMPAASLVEGLLADAQRTARVRAALTLVKLRGVVLSFVAVLVVIVVALLLSQSAAVDIDLLWRRFWYPRANLPRDSDVLLAIESVNGRAFQGAIEPIPENTPIELAFAIRRRGGWFERKGTAVISLESLPPEASLLRGRTPALEVLERDGVVRRELSWRGGRWLFTQNALAESMRFRVRAGDALSAEHEQALLRRIRLAKVEYSLRYPRYTKLGELRGRTLDSRRLAAITGSRIEFEMTLDMPAEQVDVSFEPFQKSAEESKGKLLTREELLALRGAKKATPPQRRSIAVSRPGETTARFRIEVEETGLLRMSARGTNGFNSDELAVIVDAIVDAPPRLVVTGLEPETWVVPGETVAYQYRAEDDFAVTDVVMNWKAGGVVATFDFIGEEMIKSKDLGKSVVAGQELVQRMNYPNIEGRPLEFWLTAVDSKGQEAKTPSFKVYIADEDYAARVDRGLAHLAAIESSANTLKTALTGLDNRMNVLVAVAGESKRWPADKASVLDDFVRQARQASPGPLDLAPQIVGGLPARIERAAVLLTAGRGLLAGGEELAVRADSLRTSDDLPTTMTSMRALVRAGVESAEQVRAAAAGERARFVSESLLQKGMAIERRLVALLASRGNKELFEANRTFVLGQVKALGDAAKPWSAERSESPAAGFVADLLKACEMKDAEAALPAVRSLSALWLSESPGPSGPMRALQAWMADRAAGEGRSRAIAVCETLLVSRGRAELFEPRWVLSLGAAMRGSFTAGDKAWTGAGPSRADIVALADQLREDVRSYRMDVLSGRYALQPSWSWDRAAELREFMLALGDLAAASDLDDAARSRIAKIIDRWRSARLHSVIGVEAKSLVDELANFVGDASERIAVDANEVKSSGAALAGAMRALADESLAHGESITMFTAKADRPLAETQAAAGGFQAAGRAIARRAEAVEAWGRALSALGGAARLRRGGPAIPWSEVESLHAQPLLLTWISLTAQEKLVDAHFARTTDVAKWPGLYAGTQAATASLATELRSGATFVEAVSSTGRGDGDFAGWMARLNTGGYLGVIREEHEGVSALLAQSRDVKAATMVAEKVRASALGKPVSAERMAAVAAVTRERMSDTSATRKARAAELAATIAVLAPLEDRALSDVLSSAVRGLESASGQPPSPPASTGPATQPFIDAMSPRERSAVVAALDGALNTLNGMARPPALRAAVSSARRNLSGVAGMANIADRRWAQRLRAAEMSLLRCLLDSAEARGEPAVQRPLALQATRLWELRARNITQERRANRGVSAMTAEDTPTIRLPRHIEAELVKARNTKTPESFREWIEAYYGNLYRDLAP